jgi:FAD:protein FMN transferase
MNILKKITQCGVILSEILILGCSSGKEKLYSDSKVVMGTVVEITVAHGSESVARSAIGEAMEEFQRIDALTSHYKPDSIVSRINREGSSEKIPVDREVFQLLRDAVAISRASQGAFDPTILPVVELWGMDQGGRIPDSALLAKNLPMVGYDGIEFDESKLSVGLHIKGMRIDLGAIAKGWAVDKAMDKLKARGIENAIIDAGGDLRIIGSRPGKDFWRIGVQHPRRPGELLLTFSLRDTAIVTSGDYERFFIADGVRYHHILDPATGYPARGCQSVTVLAPTATEADACATAAFVLGPEKGLAFLRARPGVRGLVVGPEGALHWSNETLRSLVSR